MRNTPALGTFALGIACAVVIGCGSGNTGSGAGGSGTMTTGSGTTSHTGAGGETSSTTGSGGSGGAATGTTSTSTSTSTTSGTGTGSTTTTSGSTAVSNLTPGDLVISEIMNNPASVLDNEGEWFEVHNPTANPVDLAGLVLDDGVGTAIVGSSVTVAPGGYAVLGLNADMATNGGVAVHYAYTTIKLQNSTGTLTLRAAGNVVVDTVHYDEASGLDPDGQSRTLDPQFLSASMNDTDVHWCAATSFINGASGDKGTPGKPNDPCP